METSPAWMMSETPAFLNISITLGLSRRALSGTCVSAITPIIICLVSIFERMRILRDFGGSSDIQYVRCLLRKKLKSLLEYGSCLRIL